MSVADTTRAPLPHRARAWLFGVVVPAAVIAAGWGLVLRWVPRLPEQVALHWGVGGVDRVGPVRELFITTGVISGTSFVVLAVLSLTVGRTALTRRMVLALATGTAVYFTGILVAQAAAQLGLDDPHRAAVPDLGLALATAAAVLAGFAAGLLAGADPERPTTAPVPDGASRATLGAHERAVWAHRVSAGHRVQRWAWALGALYVALGIALGVAAESWFVFVIFVAVLPPVLTMFVWDVRVDASGLTAKGALGWPRQHVPSAEIERAEVTEVRPFRQFGGWGLRISLDGTVGVVVRAGEAIAVHRTGGRRFVVTVDDAATGAALLNTFAERSRAGAR
ncbi:DUF1648 domain-containing protein [Georgenia sp. SYP-B2076]|uniref:DUF1648 domain-containing protein n=1 Tax=Georgenia sp. SYP-B2076 TaxID=2495881 RepID=UPI000F8D6C67|nr:DUF1648 domain-containing protein [Georgenia sp. SYP-B2076]